MVYAAGAMWQRRFQKLWGRDAFRVTVARIEGTETSFDGSKLRRSPTTVVSERLTLNSLKSRLFRGGGWVAAGERLTPDGTHYFTGGASDAGPSLPDRVRTGSVPAFVVSSNTLRSFSLSNTI